MMHSLKVTVWCETVISEIVGPYFFSDNKTETVNINSYQQYWNPLSCHISVALKLIQQDNMAVFSSYSVLSLISMIIM